MKREDKTLVQGCAAVIVALSHYVMIGVVFIYAITHW